MYSTFKNWIGTWIILTGVFYYVESLSNTQKEIPHDVFLPLGENKEILPPVIMLHGLLDWRKTFKMLAPEIAKNTGRMVYAYDLLNHGENEWTEEMDHIMLVSQLDEFMQQHNISKAILYGHSLGGKISMYFAVQKPEKVEKLIIEDMSPKIPSPEISALARNGFKLVKLGLTQFSSEEDEIDVKKFALRVTKRVVPIGQMDEFNDFLLEWVPITKRGEKIDMLANLDLVMKISETQETDKMYPNLVGEFHGDALFLCGPKSIFDACNDQLIPKHFPHSTLVKFEGGNHFLHFQFFKEFERAVSDFINTKSSAQ